MQRFITGALLIIISIVLIILSKWAMACFIIPAGIVGILEFYKLAEGKGISPSISNGIFSVVILYLSALFFSRYMIFVLLSLVLLTMFVFVLRKDNHVSSILDASVTILGYIYIGWFFSLLFNIRDVVGTVTITACKLTIDQGAAMVFLLLFTTCFTDIGSFCFGKLFGKTKLCPDISPNKTVEGAIGGIFTGIVITFIVGRLLSLSLLDSLYFGLIITVVAQMGDLWESVLKRDVEVKDSGEALPGHGGVLDRIDSLLLSTPVAYMLFKFFIGF